MRAVGRPTLQNRCVVTQLYRTLVDGMPCPIKHNGISRVLWLRALAVIVVLASLSMVQRVVVLALESSLGLLALGVLLILGWGALRSLPAFGEWCEKRLLRTRLADARANPIDELLQYLIERSVQLERYRAALATVAVQIAGLREMLDSRRAAAPQLDVAKQTVALEKMQVFYAQHTTRLRTAEYALAEYKQHLNSKRFEWEFARAGEAVLTGLRASGREGIVRELMHDEATRAVQASFTRVFAALDADLVSVEATNVGDDARFRGDNGTS
jgi:hypothetical protein